MPKSNSTDAPAGVAVMTLGQLAATDLTPPRVLCDGAVQIREGERTMIYGHPGTLKTMLLFDVAVRIAVSAPVLLFLGEGSPYAVRARLQQLARGAGVAQDVLNDRITLVRGGFDPTKNGDFMKHMVSTVKPTLVVFDPVISYLVGDGNSDSVVAAFLRSFEFIPPTRAALALVHHARKDSRHAASDLRGSGAYRGWEDALYRVERATAAVTEVTVTCEKERDHEVRDPMKVTFEFGEEVILVQQEPAELNGVSRSRGDGKPIDDALRHFLRGHHAIPPTKAKIRGALSRSSKDVTAGLDRLGDEIEPFEVSVKDKRGRPRREIAYRLRDSVAGPVVHESPAAEGDNGFAQNFGDMEH